MQHPNPIKHKYLQFNDYTSYRRYVQNSAPDTLQTDIQSKKILNDGAHGTYGAMLFHPKWKEKRKEILNRDRHRCVNCKSEKGLQIHHRQYHFIESQNKFRLPWDYPDHLLITLCELCHNRGHKKYKVPTILI